MKKGFIQTKKPNKAKNSQAIISTAFQDHITKQLNLNGLLATKASSQLNKPRVQTSQIKSKVDTGLPKRNIDLSLKSRESIEKEYVISKPPCPADLPTLAEKYGLIPVAEARLKLDETEWSKVKQTYKTREDYKQPCVICKEQLGAQQQVLLSCTHTFHRTCLEVFEKFSGKKCCPMCRKEKYQTRVVYDASKYYKDLCASKIQATWRAYLVRKWYKNYRKLVPPQNPALRKKFFEEKVNKF